MAALNAGRGFCTTGTTWRPPRRSCRKRPHYLRAVGDIGFLTQVLIDLGTLALADGDIAAAYAYFGEALGAAQAMKDRIAEANLRNNLGEVARLTGDDAAAAEHYARACASTATWTPRTKSRGCCTTSPTWRCMGATAGAPGALLARAWRGFAPSGSSVGWWKPWWGWPACRRPPRPLRVRGGRRGCGARRRRPTRPGAAPSGLPTAPSLPAMARRRAPHHRRSCL